MASAPGAAVRFLPPSRRAGLEEWAALALAIACLGYALHIAIAYVGQPPLDLHRFRQTQTALTAYWLGHNGFALAYETPVAGPPWSIPFEFPLYQYLVALVAQTGLLSLDAAGRLLSFALLLLCLLPAAAITRDLRLSRTTFYLFAALLLSSPLYLYWGRAFMIETTALFLAITGIKYFIDLLQERRAKLSAALFVLFITLAILQKATTGLPVLAVLACVYLGFMVKEWRADARKFPLESALRAVLLFGLPLAVGIAWTLYTDQVKSQNDLGVQLTSQALSEWNWGTLGQRWSALLYTEVLWQRMLLRNLGGVLGLAVLAAALIARASRPAAPIILVSIALGLLPLLLFTNLHLVHTYYQTGCLVFLIYGVAVALGQGLHPGRKWRYVAVGLVAVLIGSNHYWFTREQLPIVKREFNATNCRDCTVGEFLRNRIPEDQYFVAFGNEWSSALAYLSQRKSFTVPPFYRNYEDIARHPERFIDEDRLGAVVACPSPDSPKPADLVRWSSSGRSWRVVAIAGCLVAVPASGLSVPVSGAADVVGIR